MLDTKTTPVDAVMPGVEVHAQILESVLTKTLLVQPNYAIGAELVAAVLFGLAIIIAAPMLSPRPSLFSAPCWSPGWSGCRSICSSRTIC